MGHESSKLGAQKDLLDSRKAGFSPNKLAKKDFAEPLQNQILGYPQEKAVEDHKKTITIPNEPLQAAVPLTVQDYNMLNVPPHPDYQQQAQITAVYPPPGGFSALVNHGAGAGGGNMGGGGGSPSQQFAGININAIFFFKFLASILGSIS
jgi:hypothetical protein